MTIFTRSLFFILGCTLTLSAWGQIILDPALQQNKASSADDELDERFQAPQKPASNENKKKKAKKVDRPPASEDSTKVIILEAPKAAVEQSSDNKDSEKSSLGKQMKVLFLGGDDEIEEFNKQINPGDRRLNHLEISLAPVYFYDASQSSYSVRRFTVSGTGVEGHAKVWGTPFFGLAFDYFSSLNSSVASRGSQQNVSATYQNIGIGVRFRKHFGFSRKAPSVAWGLSFIQDSMNVPGNTSDRVSTTTSGLSLGLHLDLPSSLTYSHSLGLEFQPRLVHSEKSDLQIQSGGSSEADAIDAYVGGDFIFDRRNQIYWKLDLRLEQIRFSGAGSQVDPVTGSTPNGASILRSTTFFSIGYHWGS